MNPAAATKRRANTGRFARTQEPLKHIHGTNEVLPSDRSRELHLIHEALARARMDQRLRTAELPRKAAPVRMARRIRRRAEAASMRARRALATVVMQ